MIKWSGGRVEFLLCGSSAVNQLSNKVDRKNEIGEPHLTDAVLAKIYMLSTFSLCPSADMEGVGFMNNTAASQQGDIGKFKLHYWKL